MANEASSLLMLVRTAVFGDCFAGHCVKCKQPFTSANVFTAAGWKETKLSELCEVCWDTLFAEEG